MLVLVLLILLIVVAAALLFTRQRCKTPSPIAGMDGDGGDDDKKAKTCITGFDKLVDKFNDDEFDRLITIPEEELKRDPVLRAGASKVAERAKECQTFTDQLKSDLQNYNEKEKTLATIKKWAPAYDAKTYLPNREE